MKRLSRLPRHFQGAHACQLPGRFVVPVVHQARINQPEQVSSLSEKAEFVTEIDPIRS